LFRLKAVDEHYVSLDLPIKHGAITLDNDEEKQVESNFERYKKIILESTSLTDVFQQIVEVFHTDVVKPIECPNKANLEQVASQFMLHEREPERILSADLGGIQQYVQEVNSRLKSILDMKQAIFKKQMEKFKEAKSNVDVSKKLQDELFGCTDLALWTFGSSSLLSHFAPRYFNFTETATRTYKSAPLVCFEGVVQKALARYGVLLAFFFFGYSVT
jgi:hypothetical protein